ncbi:uncharacterized protein KQ657_003653 [Scheffersomyces spartinae]|uniref:Sporulation-specific protein SPO7 n=1 Tax=Scheffersomyces spartinae TaxID=45513 RepID=A0A9P7VC20_9ASCO|nr:uncharacterized protein KQ657_003653 [Scheffersomyces spartinae]KAG7195132.1 hypothetical protein KQ657_003653 [Scheffersomyces spartinae]
MTISSPPLRDSSVDAFVIYSDSDGDGGSLNSLDIPRLSRRRRSRTNQISSTRSRSRSKSTEIKLEGNSPDIAGTKRRSRPRRKSAGSGSLSLEGSPKPGKRKPRRKSTKSEGGSSIFASGYTSTPATGKIFRNLLILEENLRQQVIQQRALRRKYLTFLAILCCLITSISHVLYFNQSEATTIKGPFRVILQLILLALLVTIMLYHLSGEYQKTIVLPRKFLSSSNKGLRQLNVRLVKIKTPWSDQFVDILREMGLFISTMCLKSVHKVYPLKRNNPNSKLEVFLVSCLLKCQPRLGITDVKLVLNARVFKTHVREGWDLYRNEFWIQEGVRRRKQMLAFIEEQKGKSLTKKRKRAGTRLTEPQ